MISHRALTLALALLTLNAVPAAAQTSRAAMETSFAAALPNQTLVGEALDVHPDIQTARAQLEVARAQARQLAVGEHEFVLSGTWLERRVRNDASYSEYSAELSRAVRLPGKAALDREAGALGERAAEESVGDARHQTGLLLADSWFSWIEAGGQVALDRQTESSLERDVAALRRRVELKDAAMVELEQAESALAVARSRRALSEGVQESARLTFEMNFAKLPLPAAALVLPDPAELDRPLAEWPLIVVERSHEIEIADFRARRAQAVAARARRDRQPDPTIGIRSVSEFSGREQTIGVFASTPFGGGWRSAAAAGETARAAAAQVALLKVRREIETLGKADSAAVKSSHTVWSNSFAAVEAAAAAAVRTRRGYELDELDLAQVLLADRQLYEARRGEIAARTDAWRALVKLRLDAHDLWAADDRS